MLLGLGFLVLMPIFVKKLFGNKFKTEIKDVNSKKIKRG